MPPRDPDDQDSTGHGGPSGDKRLQEVRAERRAVARERALLDRQLLAAQAEVDRLNEEVLAQRRREADQAAAARQQAAAKDPKSGSGTGGSSGQA